MGCPPGEWEPGPAVRLRSRSWGWASRPSPPAAVPGSWGSPLAPPFLSSFISLYSQPPLLQGQPRVCGSSFPPASQPASPPALGSRALRGMLPDAHACVLGCAWGSPSGRDVFRVKAACLDRGVCVPPEIPRQPWLTRALRWEKVVGAAPLKAIRSMGSPWSSSRRPRRPVGGDASLEQSSWPMAREREGLAGSSRRRRKRHGGRGAQPRPQSAGAPLQRVRLSERSCGRRERSEHFQPQIPRNPKGQGSPFPR